jgi:hypothetical protein
MAFDVTASRFASDLLLLFLWPWKEPDVIGNDLALKAADSVREQRLRNGTYARPEDDSSSNPSLTPPAHPYGDSSPSCQLVDPFTRVSALFAGACVDLVALEMTLSLSRCLLLYVSCVVLWYYVLPKHCMQPTWYLAHVHKCTTVVHYLVFLT